MLPSWYTAPHVRRRADVIRWIADMGRHTYPKTHQGPPRLTARAGRTVLWCLVHAIRRTIEHDREGSRPIRWWRDRLGRWFERPVCAPGAKPLHPNRIYRQPGVLPDATAWIRNSLRAWQAHNACQGSRVADQPKARVAPRSDQDIPRRHHQLAVSVGSGELMVSLRASV